MNHKEALETLALEKYLLNEFGLDEKEAFEEHFFSCDECAQDVKAGAALLQQGKRVLRQDEERLVERRPITTPRRSWFAWLRPAFAIPVMALLLGVVAFQNLVQLPSMQQSLTAMNAPAVLPSAYLASGSVRGNGPLVVAKPGQIFQVTIDIPDAGDTPHTAELYDAAGRKLWSLEIPENAPRDGLSIRMPGDLASGTYSLAVDSVSAQGHPAVEKSRYVFELRRS